MQNTQICRLFLSFFFMQAYIFLEILLAKGPLIFIKPQEESEALKASWWMTGAG